MLTGKVGTQRSDWVASPTWVFSWLLARKVAYSAVRFAEVLRFWLLTSPMLTLSRPQRFQALEDSQYRFVVALYGPGSYSS